MYKFAVWGLLALVLVVPSASAAPITIDDYTSPGGQGIVAPGGTVSLTSTLSPAANLAAGLANQRTYNLSAVTGSADLNAALAVAAGALRYSNQDGISSVANLTYDGLLNLDNFTQFSFDAPTNDGGTNDQAVPGEITISDGTNSATAGFNIPDGGQLGIVIPRAAFGPLLALVDDSAITQITVSFNGAAGTPANTSVDLSFDNLQVDVPNGDVPEPTTLVCLSVGLVCAAGARYFRRRKTQIAE